MGKKSWLPPPTLVELTGPQNIEKCTHEFDKNVGSILYPI